MSRHNLRHAFLGTLPNGNLTLCASEYDLNPVGARLEPPSLPAIVKQFQRNPDPDQALPALQALQKYLNGEDIHEEAPVFGETLEKKRRKTR